MNLFLVHNDIAEVTADALIYSTNIRLALTGGVGAALLRKFGIGMQIQLQDASLGSGRQMAEVGEVFETCVGGSPWKRIFHTIATDELYRTDPGVVENILRGCLHRCALAGDIHSVVSSALGAGYGDLDIATFVQIASRVCGEFHGSSIQNFSLVVFDQDEFNSVCEIASKYGAWIQKA
jgi:O-acetyl-ADP-ribose deacetylase (regulator of RNase III)